MAGVSYMHSTDGSLRGMLSSERRIVMDIEGHLIMDSANFKPIISRVAAQGDRVYVCGITGDPVGDVTAQTKQALDRIDDRLARSGTDKSKLLTAQVWLSDMALFRTHNVASNEWVNP